MTNVTALKQEPEIFQPLEKIKAEIDAKTDDLVIEAIPKLVKAESYNAAELGGHLSRVKQEKLWADDQNFEKFLISQNISRGRGYAMAKAFDALVKCNLPTDILDVCGWSKLCMISAKLKPGKSKKAAENNDQWIDMATKMARDTLKDHLALINYQPKGPSDLTQHVFKLPFDKEETFKTAVDKAKKEVNVETEVEAVDAILTGYLESKTKVVTLKSLMQASQPEDVLKMFVEIWPNIDVTVKL